MAFFDLHLSPEGDEGNGGGGGEGGKVAPKIKIGDQELTSEEIKSGMMLQKDYTQKVTELKQERQKLAQMLDGVAFLEGVVGKMKTDPEGALRDFKSLMQQTKGEVKTGNAETDAQIERVMSKMAVLELDMALDRMRRDTVFEQNEDNILEYAEKNQIPSIEVAFKAWKTDNPDKLKVEKKPSRKREAEASARAGESTGDQDKSGFKFDPTKPAGQQFTSYLQHQADHQGS